MEVAQNDLEEKQGNLHKSESEHEKCLTEVGLASQRFKQVMALRLWALAGSDDSLGPECSVVEHAVAFGAPFLNI